MSHQSELIATDVEAYLAEHEHKDLLRFLTCGSVDDGKSTLIGRLLHDSKLIYEDQLAAIRADSVTMGSAGDQVDLALLMDGLKAEREQGITIDVAYRYFSTARRKFIIADTPGHEQYTRNMVTGASTCDLAVILIDARAGVLRQTKRHSFIASLLGIRHIVVAVNKMDLVGWSRPVFEQIRADYLDFAAKLEIENVYFLPISALTGDNVVEPGPNMTWFDGSPLLDYLETVKVDDDVNVEDFRYPVQYVIRPDLSFRGYSGTVASGVVRPGDAVKVLPSGVGTRVDRIVTADGDLEVAVAGQAVTIVIEDAVDVSRGDMLVRPDSEPERGHHVDAMIVWMSDEPMVPGRQYLVRQATKVSNASISTLHHRIDVNTLEHHPAPTLELNEIGRCTVSADQELLYDAYSRNRVTGAFVLIDKLSNGTVAAGMALADAESGLWDTAPTTSGLVKEVSKVTPAERRARFGQRPACILLTGLAGAGKSTIALALERRLFDAGRAATVLDGQAMRLGLSKELGFGAQDRSENLRRAAEVAKLVNDAGLLAILAFVAPSEEVRDRVRRLVGGERFLVVHLDAPLDVCRRRDPGGLYAAAATGRVPDFPGVSFPYDAPAAPDLRLDTDADDVETCVERIVEMLVERGVVPRASGRR